MKIPGFFINLNVGRGEGNFVTHKNHLTSANEKLLEGAKKHNQQFLCRLLRYSAHVPDNLTA
jgi:hypothetical protein